MTSQPTLEGLRISLLAGELGRGGAEKQFVYLVRALCGLGADLQLLSLTRNEHYESNLIELGLHPISVGRFRNPVIRLVLVTAIAQKHRPLIFQTSHFYANLYVSLLPRISGSTLGIGSIRGNVYHEVEANGRWSHWLLRAPTILVANSHTAKENAGRFGVNKENIYVLPNAIDLNDFDAQSKKHSLERLPSEHYVAVIVARLVEVKRVERFLQAVAIARQDVPNLTGWIIGDGPQRQFLEAEANSLGLLPDGVRFWGARSDVPNILRQADIFVLTSDREGFPNVLLEAMAASLPVITTPAGDASIVVQDGLTGFVVPGTHSEQIAERLVYLAKHPAQRAILGAAGRSRVENTYSYNAFPQTLKALYLSALTRHSSKELQNFIAAQ